MNVQSTSMPLINPLPTLRHKRNMVPRNLLLAHRTRKPKIRTHLRGRETDCLREREVQFVAQRRKDRGVEFLRGSEGGDGDGEVVDWHFYDSFAWLVVL